MLLTRQFPQEAADQQCTAAYTCADEQRPMRDIEALLQGVPLRRRTLKAKEHVFRAGQPRRSLFLVHAGFFKTCLTSTDGREKITGFRMRGDMLGLDSLDIGNYACDAIALDVGEVWELPYADLCGSVPEFERCITSFLAAEIRRDWGWMLTLATLSADQRVASFLLDLATRLGALGFSPRRMTLRMTRADLGSFLALKLETVTRALTRLQSSGLIQVRGKEIVLRDPVSMNELLQTADCD
jgi:CRP/FNR family transcriptional regulator